MVKWIKVKPLGNDPVEATVKTEFLRTDAIVGVRELPGGVIQVRADTAGFENWKTAHDSSENTVEFTELLQALNLTDAA